MRLHDRCEKLKVTGRLSLGAQAHLEDPNGNTSYLPGMVTLDATGTIAAARHAFKTLLMAESGGDAAATFTLPGASGSGHIYRFVVGVVNTSNYVIQVASADDVMCGVIIANSTGDTPDLAQPWPTAATSDTITLNGTTSGGTAIGDYVELQDIAAGQWAVSGVVNASGTEVTPFSAAVS